MGNFFRKDADNRVETMPVLDVIKRLDEFIMPDDKEAIIDMLELIENKLTLAPNKTKKNDISDQLKEFSGVPLILDLLNQLLSDPSAATIGVTIFELQRTHIPIVTEFILYGGIDYLQKVQEQHEKNEFLAMSVPKLLSQIKDIGAIVAIDEINKEALSLQMCQKCQETVEKFKRMKNATAKEVKIPKSSDRVNRVIMFMNNYVDRVDVQVPGLDAIIAFIQNADGKNSVRDTNVIEVIVGCLQKHQNEPSIVWRCAMIVTNVSAVGMDLAYEFTFHELHEIVATIFPKMSSDYRIKQQILWMLSQFVEWPKSQKKIQQSKTCMKLLKSLEQEREKYMEEMLEKPTKKAFEVVMPLPLRRFMRETGGEILDDGTGNKPKIKEKKKKIQDPNAKKKKDWASDEPVIRYGTLYSKIFTEGEAGLIDEDEEEVKEKMLAELNEEDRAAIDWESKLTYGKPKKKKEKVKLKNVQSDNANLK